MPDPFIEFYEQDDTTLLTNSGVNPLDFGTIAVGSSDNEPIDSNQIPFHLWNDIGAVLGADTAINMRFLMKDTLGGDTGQFIIGTAANGNNPFYKARSFGSSGAPDDNQTAFTIIGGSQFLSIGNMASNQRRDIHVQIDIPIDATNEIGVNRLLLTFDSTP